jgi:hypothetical protein
MLSESDFAPAGAVDFRHPCRGVFAFRLVPVVALVPRFTTG